MANGPFPDIPDWVFEADKYGDQLVTFLKNPKRTLLTIFLSAFVGGVLDIFEPILDAISLGLFGGSVTTTEGDLGLTDIPLVVLNKLSDGGQGVANLFVNDGYIADLGSWISDLVASTGFLAWPLTVFATVGMLVAAIRILEVGAVSVVESIPVVGPLILNLIGK